MAQQSEFTVPIETQMSEHDGSDMTALNGTNGSLARLRLQNLEGSKPPLMTNKSSLPPGSILTGKQEHCMVKESLFAIVNVITILQT